MPCCETAAGRRIYTLGLRLFPGFRGNAFVVDDGSRPFLVDCGSGQEMSNADLDRGLERLAAEHGITIGYSDLDTILVTHGHIDHFGGLGHLRERTEAPIVMHLLDRRVPSRYGSRLMEASAAVRSFLEKAGIREQRQRQYLDLYLGMKRLFHEVPVDVGVEEGEALDGRVALHHTPGHCPGHLCVQVDDVLLTGDHLLASISPHIHPESITLQNGLDHYLQSLDRVSAVDGIRVGLGGHGGPIADIYGRAREIRAEHELRLERILELTAEPRTLFELSKAVFGPVRSYHAFLALLETGALVEYLDERGYLAATNLDRLAETDATGLLYRRT